MFLEVRESSLAALGMTRINARPPMRYAASPGHICPIPHPTIPSPGPSC